ncbi:MAG: DUF1697 domain-containing protein, partial [Proteobacteria bacterium]|nr:DUF1697 domain-containing protein [Pseudomonadota bacterium]
MVSMAALRDLAAELGWAAPRTLLQSGNLVFQAPEQPAEALEAALEAAIARRFDYATTVFVRDLEAWSAAIAENPYADAARDDLGHLVMMALKTAPSAEAVQSLRDAIRGRETVEARGREAFFVYPDGIGTSKLTAAVIERRFGPATGRNWNTVLKIGEALRTMA